MPYSSTFVTRWGFTPTPSYTLEGAITPLVARRESALQKARHPTPPASTATPSQHASGATNTCLPSPVPTAAATPSDVNVQPPSFTPVSRQQHGQSPAMASLRTIIPRSKLACLPCRARRKGCQPLNPESEHPVCRQCAKHGLSCDWPDGMKRAGHRNYSRLELIRYLAAEMFPDDAEFAAIIFDTARELDATYLSRKQNLRAQISALHFL
ncbi:Zn(II)2Cys6 transcription factor domain-containing protein [Phanerochaete sordida]|uniref:Zn(II)2Cys6 transcription factor domain-containing protein n=1 Tax=Phanerochaete sordida TaxID=48140 RepID=A0A9P3GRZ9_9APHY|nr:Zn(II)2Cys6 transcription factor domain-containing protein [Phanerochaete sordida]